jgi:hypothetical protein
MWEQFLTFLDSRGVFDGGKSAALYHWSNAEVWQSKRAAQRCRFERLASLPFVDIEKPFHEGPIALPGAWDFGLKTVAKALGSISPEHRVEWPEALSAGLAAMVMGWAAYRKPNSLRTTEMQVLSEYLEIDCKAMWQVLRWLRTNALEMPMSGGWYSHLQRKDKPKKKPSKRKKPSKTRKVRRSYVSDEDGLGWYRVAINAGVCDDRIGYE